MKILSVNEVIERYKDWTESQCKSQLESLRSQLAREQDHIQQTINDITALHKLINSQVSEK